MPPASPRALADAMAWLLDRALGGTLGDAGRRWAESEGSLQRWVERVEALYWRVVSERHGNA